MLRTATGQPFAKAPSVTTAGRHWFSWTQAATACAAVSEREWVWVGCRARRVIDVFHLLFFPLGALGSANLGSRRNRAYEYARSSQGLTDNGSKYTKYHRGDIADCSYSWVSGSRPRLASTSLLTTLKALSPFPPCQLSTSTSTHNPSNVPRIGSKRPRARGSQAASYSHIAMQSQSIAEQKPTNIKNTTNQQGRGVQSRTGRSNIHNMCGIGKGFYGEKKKRRLWPRRMYFWGESALCSVLF